MLLEAGVKLPLSLPNIGGGTVLAGNLVHDTRLIQPVKLVFGSDEAPADGVAGLDVGCDTCLPEVSGDGFSHRSHIRQRDASFLSSV